MTRSGRGLRACASLILATLLAACGGGDGSDPLAGGEPQARPSGYARLDTTGGTVQGSDGARLVVPANALVRPATVAIARDSTGMPELPAGTAPASDVWALTPHGTPFRAPVTVRIPFDATRLPAGEKPALLKGSPGGSWQLIEDVRVDGGFVEAELRSFSFLLVRGVPDLGVLPRAGDPPSTTQPRFAVTVTNGDFPVLPVTGITATMHQQASPGAPAQVRFSARVPSASALASFCGPGEANQLQLMRHTIPVTSYHLPGDGAGVNRLATYLRGATRSAVVLNPNAATEAAQVRLPLDTDIVVNQSVNALDYAWRDAPTNWVEDSYAWAGALYDELPPGAVEGAWGVMVKLVLSCGAWGVPMMADTAPPVVIVRGFDNNVIFIDGPPTLNAAFPGQQVEATLNTVIAPDYEPGRTDWVVMRPGSSTWEGVPAFGSATPPSGLTLWNSGGTLRMVASLADNGTRIRAQACAALKPENVPPFEQSGGVILSGCATSAEGTITVASQFPQARIVTQPGPAAWRMGDALTLRAEFEAFPLPPRTAPDTVVWQTRANAGAPWGGVPGVVNANLSRDLSATGWYQETRPIAGRNDRAEAWLFAYQPLTMADHGRQFRAILNLPGSTLTSDVVTLSVVSGLAPPVFTAQPAAVTVQAGSAATLAAAVTGGTPMSYRWLFNGQPVTGANSPTLALATVNAANAGDYVLEASNAEATVRSSPARLTVTAAPPPPVNPPTLAAPLASLTLPAGSTASFSVTATGGGVLAYQWRWNGTDIAGATGPVLTLANVAPAQAGTYTVRVSNSAGSVTSSDATLTLTAGAAPEAPQITTPPSGLVLQAGQTAVLAVAASGSGALAYQWQREGSPLVGATGPVLVIASAAPADAGSYRVVVTNGEGSITSAAAGLVVVPTPGAPTITAQPGPARTVVGATARFTATVTGNPAPQCQWTRNGIAIAGATDCSGFTTPAASADDNGALYNLIAYSPGGVALGNGALLTVSPLALPAFTTQPQNQAVAPGGETGFTVVADGSPTPTIEWGVNGGLIGASGSYVLGACTFDHEASGGTLTLRHISAGCDGTSVVAQARNLAGITLSDVVTLSVMPVQPQAMLVAGSPGEAGSADGSGSAARFSTANFLAAAADGRLAVGDFSNSTLRLVQPGGAVSTLAGTPGVLGYADGTGPAARFRNNGGVAWGPVGEIYLADWDNHAVRKITADGTVTTFAGRGGVPGEVDGIGDAARLRNPAGLAIDGAGNVYVADWGNHAIRKITPDGTVSTFAGALGQPGSANGSGSQARFLAPSGLAVDGAGNVYVADQLNHLVRRITPAGVVSTLAGAAGQAGDADGPAAAARLRNPAWITVSPSGDVFIVSDAGDTVRKITPAGDVSTVAGLLGDSSAVVLGNAPRLRQARGLWAVSSRELFVAADHAVLRLTLP